MTIIRDDSASQAIEIRRLHLTWSDCGHRPTSRGWSAAWTRGKVINLDGQPIGGAEVGWVAEQFEGDRFAPKVTTAADGGFQFNHVRPGRVWSPGQSRGACAGSGRHQVGSRTDRGAARSRPEFRRTNRRSDGKPVEGAFVNVARLGAYPFDRLVFPDRRRRSIPLRPSSVRTVPARRDSSSAIRRSSIGT